LESLEILEVPDLRDLLVRLDCKVSVVHREQLECQASLVVMEHQDSVEQLEELEIRAGWVSSAKLVQGDRLAVQVLLVSRVPKVQMV